MPVAIARLITIIAAYAAAVTVSATAGLLIVLVSTVLVEAERFWPFSAVVSDLGIVWLTMVMMTAALAWPGYLVTIVLSHMLKRRERLFFAFAGAVTAVQAAALLAFANDNLDIFVDYVATVWGILPGGALGGLAARWMLFGRTKAPWRRYS